MKNILLLIACIVVTILLGILPSYFTMNEVVNWYANLNKPSFNPPNYLFGPVWTILFALMGITLYRIIKAVDKQWQKKALIIFTIQFTLNFFWSIIFFKLHQMEIALIEIIILMFAIIFMIHHLYKKDKVAAFINLPYLAWVSFATILNLGFILIN